MNGRAYVINDLYSVYPQALNARATVDSVAILALDVRRKNGRTFLEELLDLNVIK